MISYIVKFAILHLLFFAIYKSMLAKETQLGFLRFFLVGSTLLSLILPVVEIPTRSVLSTINADAILLPVVSAKINYPSIGAPWYVIVIGVICSIFLLRLVVSLIQIYGWYKQSEVDSVEEIAIRKVPGLQNSFTFFKWIFIDPKNFENPADIIRHELGHSKKLHSLDLLLFHSLTIFFWWLPSVWLMIKEMKEVHEFEADEFALKISDQTYRKTLVHCTLKAHGMNLASSFDDAPIFNRLKFMNKMKKKISSWKVVSITTMVAISCVMFACQDELESEIERIADESSQQIIYTDEVQATLDKLEKENPGVKYAVIETMFENEESIQKLNSYDPQQIAAIFVNKNGDDKSVTMIVSQSSDLFNKAVEIQEARTDEVFTIVENSASFPGGASAFKNYLNANLEYPKQAQRIGVQGNVFVGFIVEKDGSLSNIEVLRGIGAGCDMEAVRIMEASPKWNAGTQNGKLIRQKMVQPIAFTLND